MIIADLSDLDRIRIHLNTLIQNVFNICDNKTIFCSIPNVKPFKVTILFVSSN